MDPSPFVTFLPTTVTAALKKRAATATSTTNLTPKVNIQVIIWVSVAVAVILCFALFGFLKVRKMKNSRRAAERLQDENYAAKRDRRPRTVAEGEHVGLTV